MVICIDVAIGKAIRAFILDRDDPDLQWHLLRKDEIDILHDIHQVLEIAHSTQESLSAELTPTLSMAMPLYKILIESWTVLKSTIPELSHYIDVALSKLKQYIKVVLPQLQAMIFYLVHFILYDYGCCSKNVGFNVSYHPKKELYKLDQPMLSYFT